MTHSECVAQCPNEFSTFTSQLASIKSAGENDEVDLVMAQDGDDRFHIGLYRFGEDEDWTW